VVPLEISALYGKFKSSSGNGFGLLLINSKFFGLLIRKHLKQSIKVVFVPYSSKSRIIDTKNLKVDSFLELAIPHFLSSGAEKGKNCLSSLLAGVSFGKSF